MTASRDPDVLIRAFLAEGQTELPDRAYDAVRHHVDRTRQRVVIGPWRTPNMPGFAKVAVAAAALIAVAIIGVNLLPDGPPGVGGPEETPSPAVSASPPASESPSGSPGPFPAAGPLAVGTHSIRQNGVAYTIDVPALGWTSSGVQVPPDGGTLQKGTLGVRNAAWLLFWTIDGVYSDPCGRVPGPVVSPSTAALAQAVTEIPGLEVTDPEDVTLGGRPAKHVVVTVPRELPCAPSNFYLWYDDVRCDTEDPCGRWVSAPQSTIEIWIVDVDGRHIWIEAETYNQAVGGIEDEVREIVESIRFE